MIERENRNKAFTVIGNEIPRVDAIDKVTGHAKYGADYNEKNQLYGVSKHAEFPHAEILKIDTSKAKAIDGVRAILTHKDIPGEKSFGSIHPHQRVLCDDKVRFYGDVLAIIAAESEDIAQKAANAITVKYKPLPNVNDPVLALKPESPHVHKDGNLCIHHKVRKGDIEDGFANSDTILEREYSTQRIEHSYIEPEAVLAKPGENGGVTIIGSLQNLYSIRRAVGKVIGLPLNRIRMIQATLGGSFGGKDEVMGALCSRAALLTLATGRPVKMINNRENSMRESYKRHPYKLKYKVGVKKDGALQAMEIVIHADAGAYSATSPFVTWRSVVQATGPYIVPNVKTDVYGAYTNNCYAGAMRGFGSPQICFAQESLMDELAKELDMDPLEFRLKNVLKDGAITATGQRLDHKVSVGDALTTVTDKANFKKLSNEYPKKNKNSTIKKGIGISCSYRGISLGAEGTDAAGVAVSLQTDGSVVASCGLVEMGQGSATTIAIVVAEELGVTPDRVRFLNADTTSIPDSGPTVASRTSFMAGNAAKIAVQKLLKRIKPVAADLLKCAEESLVFKGNQIFSAKDVSTTKSIISFEELSAECFTRGISLFVHGWYNAPKTTWDEETGQGDAYFTFVYGVNLAEVLVDTATGQIKVTKFISSHDCGRALNINGALGQVYGGVAMGLGYALLEEYKQEDGKPQLENFDEYLLPTICDIPDIDVIFPDNPDNLGPFGAKSLGEPACEIAAPAIVNAVFNATGMRIRDLPLTLERTKLGRNLSRKDKRGSLKAKEHNGHC